MVLSTVNISSNMDLETKQQFMKDVIAECDKVLTENSGNRCAKYCKDYLESKDGANLDSKGKLTDLLLLLKSLDIETNSLAPCNSPTRLDDLF